MDRTDLLRDPRFISRERRKQHRDELNRELNAALAARPAAEWEQLLTVAGVPAARILTVAEAVDLDQLAHRGFFAEVPFPGSPTGRTIRVSGNGVLVDGEPAHPTGPPPTLGEHNDALDETLRRWAQAPADIIPEAAQ